MREEGGERWEVDKREKWNEGGRNRNRGDRGKRECGEEMREK